jgi:predicted metal-dependent enzyme (double-stranded beta helix superfamily)
MFDTQQFIADCEAAVAEDSSHIGVREIVERAVSDPTSVLKGLGEPDKSGVQKIHNSDTLTIINVIWAPWMTIMPHNHEMWAVIGVYTGREDNMFWRRVEGAPDGHIEASGATDLSPGEASPFGLDIIHSVTNPIPRLTGAIHVYGGNFFDTPRSEWNAETLTEQPYDVEKNMRLFQEFSTT